MKYAFPAIFRPEDGHFFIFFPDLEECASQGDSLEECCELAEDVLNLALWKREERGEEIPQASAVQTIEHEAGDIVTLVKADTLAYSRLYDTKAVKKTLSIPHWLDTRAQARGVNFSYLLQQALIKELDLPAV